MRDPDFPQELCDFIQRCTPSIEAVELLLLVFRTPGREWTAAELSQALRPAVLQEAAVRELLAGFCTCGLAQKMAEGRYAAAVATSESTQLIGALERVYHARPVSLVRMIYTLREKKIRSFADAFKFRKD